MSLLTRAAGGLRALVRRKHGERELDAELCDFLEAAVEHKMLSGLDREAAVRAARLELGSAEAVKDRVRDVGWESTAEGLWRDVCYATRSLGKAPGFAAAAAITLALGIGANTAIFTLLNVVAYRPLPVQDPGRLVSLQYERRDGRSDSFFSYPQFDRLHTRTRALSGLFAASALPRMNLIVDGQAGIATATLVSGDFFSILGVSPHLGRLLSAEDDRAANAVAVISHAYWQSRLGSDPGVIGRNITLNGVPVTIVGVTPPGFFGVVVGSGSDVMLPMRLSDRVTLNRRWWNQPFLTWLQMVGRLAPGVSEDAARAELAGIFRQAQSEFAATGSESEQRLARESELRLASAAAGLDGRARTFTPALRFLMGIAAIVLLIACANIASLFLARAHSRQREITIRLAIGASRLRLVRQFLTEAALVGATGGALGLGLAVWGSAALATLVATESSRIRLDTTPDPQMLAFTTVVSCSTVLLFGLAPALHATRSHAGVAMFGLRSTSTARLGWHRALVVGQIALSFVLVLAAAVSLRTVRNLLAVETGYNRDHVLMFSTDASLARYEGVKAPALYTRVQDALATIPGVLSASMASVRPIDSEGYLVGSVGVVDGQPLTGDRRIRYAFNVLGSGYFSALQIPLLAGRDFGPQDEAGAPHVAIINESMARRLFGDANPLGRHFGQNTREMVEVVGVVRDTKYGNLVDAPRPVLYLPIGQTPWASQTTFLLRYTGAGETLTNVVRQRLSAVDPDLPMFRINTLDLEARESVLRQRLLALVSTSFGLVALLLAAVGLYGLMLFAVAQRSKEIGVRMALGADRKRVVRMTLAESLSLIALGILIGVPSGVVMTYAARSLLFGLTPGDPLSIVLVVATMTAVVLVAGYIPARRAAGVDPMVALRVD